MKGKTLIKILLIVLFIAALGFLIGAVYRFTDGFNEDFKTMYLERDGEKVLSSTTSAHFDPGEKVTYAVKYTFPSGKEKVRDYTVSISPNADADFEFQVDGITRLWRAQDLSAVFPIQKQESSFSFSVPESAEIFDILRKLYPTQKIGFPDDLDRQQCFFALNVTSYNKAVAFTVCFSCYESESRAISTEIQNGESYSIDFQCPETAKPGTTVQFTLRALGVYTITSVKLTGTGIEDQSLTPVGGAYSHDYQFTMPDCDVTIVIELFNVAG